MNRANNGQKPQSKSLASEAAAKSDPKPYDPGSYRIINKETVTIYSPNVIGKKKRIISV